MKFILGLVIDNTLGQILDVSRIVVDPRQGYILAIMFIRIPAVLRFVFLNVSQISIRTTEVQFIDVNLVEGLVEVLFRATFEELSLYFKLRDSCDRERAVLIEIPVAQLAIESHLLRSHIRAVYAAEDVNILRASAERERDS